LQYPRQVVDGGAAAAVARRVWGGLTPAAGAVWCLMIVAAWAVLQVSAVFLLCFALFCFFLGLRATGRERL